MTDARATHVQLRIVALQPAEGPGLAVVATIAICDAPSMTETIPGATAPATDMTRLTELSEDALATVRLVAP